MEGGRGEGGGRWEGRGRGRDKIYGLLKEVIDITPHSVPIFFSVCASNFLGNLLVFPGNELNNKIHSQANFIRARSMATR